MSKRKTDADAGAPPAKKNGDTAAGNIGDAEAAGANSAAAMLRAQLSSRRAAVTLKLSALLRSNKTFAPKLAVVTSMLLEDAQRDHPLIDLSVRGLEKWKWHLAHRWPVHIAPSHCPLHSSTLFPSSLCFDMN